MFFLAAISLGFLGSFHCIGMCGPIALTIPVKRDSAFSIISGTLTYNLGRVSTYAVLGVVFGLVGQGFALAGLQNVLSITLGLLLLIGVLFPKIPLIPFKIGFIYSALAEVKTALSGLFGTHSTRALFLIGLLNGLLPCGLVYLAIAGSIATANALSGAVFMAGFGLGTLPAMMAITVARDYISIKFRERIRQVVPVAVGVMAILLILRGMNLDIPYISPAVQTHAGITQHQCCHK